MNRRYFLKGLGAALATSALVKLPAIEPEVVMTNAAAWPRPFDGSYMYQDEYSGVLMGRVIRLADLMRAVPGPGVAIFSGEIGSYCGLTLIEDKANG